jgi:hypothetical protein
VIRGTHSIEARALVCLALLAAIFIILATLSAHGAEITECSATRRHDGAWWAYRDIDGRRCWYRGQPGRSKTLLRWAKASPPASPSGAVVGRPEIGSQSPSDLGAASTPTLPEELAARALSNKEALWRPTPEDQEKALTCCWPEQPAIAVTRSVEGNQPIKDQGRYTPIEMPSATPPARSLWPFMLLMVGLLGGSILLARWRLR